MPIGKSESPQPDPGERPVLNVEGELVALGPLRRDLLPLYARWINEPETAAAVGSYLPFTAEREAAWYEGEAKSETNIPFTIYERSALRPIGTVALMNVDYRNRRAEFGIGIGEPGYRNKGYGTETTRLMLGYAFDTVGLHSVMLGVFEFNRMAMRAYQKAGFKEIGRRRQSYFANGRMHDEIWMDCLSSEFEGLGRETTR